MNLLHAIQAKFHDALAGLTPDVDKYAAMVRPTQDAKHGDYQADFAMSLGKQLGKKPRDVAQTAKDRLHLGEELESAEIAGPGFINLKLRSDWLARQLQEMARDERLGVTPANPKKTVVIDFSSPNVAKPLHVGHLRSTIIGDALARLYRFLGHVVITDNHLGDWGTQFGILLYGYKNFRDEAALEKDPVRELARLYVHVRQLMAVPEGQEAEEAKNLIAEAARQETARLHAGDPENVQLWQKFMPWCMEEIEAIYRRLDVHFDHTFGESFYQPLLAGTVLDLLDKGIAQLSDGAVIIAFGEDKPPALVRKTDGAYNYTTTDLATVRYRVEHWKPEAILYVVDSRQALHFQNLFEACRRWGYDRVALEHIKFGSVLGDNRKPLQTRAGGVLELGALLDEAVRRAGEVYEQLQKESQERGHEVPQFSPEEKERIYEVVGLGAVKYADLCQNRVTDYVFNWSKMLAMNGNTATYMQYAYARNRSILRESGEDPASYRADPPYPILETPHERALALALLRFEEALTNAAADYQPSGITSYLWDLAKSYSGFFQNCPVLKAPSPELRRSRLLLCELTSRVIQCGLDLLGIRTVERM